MAETESKPATRGGPGAGQVVAPRRPPPDRFWAWATSTEWRAAGTHRLVSDNAVLMALTFASSALNLGFQWVMARTLEPGQYASSVALIGLFSIVVVPGVVMSTVATKLTGDLFARGDVSALASRYRAAARLGVVFGTAVGFAGLIFGPAVAGLLKTSDAWGTGWALTGFGFALAAATPRGVALGIRRFGRIGVQLLIEAGARVVLGAIFIVIGFGVAGALGGVAMALLLSGILGLVLMRRPLRDLARAQVRDHIVQPLRLGSQLKIGAVSLSVALLANLDVILVRALLDDAASAGYAASTLAGRILFFAAVPITWVLLPHVIVRWNRGRPLGRALLVSVGLQAGILMAGAIGLVLFRDVLFRVAFGGRYQPDLAILGGYAAVAVMLSLTFLLAHFLIGVSHVRVWRPMLAAPAAVLVIALARHQTSLSVLTTAAGVIAVTLVYLLIETGRFFRSNLEAA